MSEIKFNKDELIAAIQANMANDIAAIQTIAPDTSLRIIAEIVASLLILTPDERTEVATAMAAQDSTTASDFASRLLNACYEKRHRADVQRMVRSALTVTEEEADIDKQLKLA